MIKKGGTWDLSGLQARLWNVGIIPGGGGGSGTGVTGFKLVSDLIWFVS